MKKNQLKKVKEQHKKVQRIIQPRKNISSAGEVLMSRPLLLAATSGDSDGEIDLVWEPVEKAHTYVIQKCIDSKSTAKWMNEDIVAKSSYTVSNLKSSRKYWFRVAAVGRKGQGPWSEPVQKKAP